MEHNVEFPPSQYLYCVLSMMVLFISLECSILMILSMTFDRFYSIIRPHKAASFNTVKRAKITVICIVIFSIIFNIPHWFISGNANWECLPYGGATGKLYGEIHYWLSFLVDFALPFVLLLGMNSVIIHKLRTRSLATKIQNNDDSRHGNREASSKNSDGQVFAILLLVTFGFLVLVTPAYSFFLYVMVVDFMATPKRFAEYYLFYNVAQKLRLTNHGINFFFYVISGERFRTDLIKLFKFGKSAEKNIYSNSKSTEVTSVSA